MEKKTFHTLVNGGDARCNDYVIGRISGVGSVICDEAIEFALRKLPGGDRLITHECEWAKYIEFVKKIEEMYPNLCEFYVHMDCLTENEEET